MKQQIVRFWREEDGITALEYGVLAAVILVAIGIFASYVAGLFKDGGFFQTQVHNAIHGNNG